MRVLIAVHGYPPTHTGGAERRAARTARQLAERGHDVFVMAVESIGGSCDALAWEDQDEDGVTVRRLNLGRSSSADPFVASYANPLSARAMQRAVEEWQPEVVHLFSGYLMSASVVDVAVENELPVVVSLTDYWWFCHRITLVRSSGERCDGPTALDCARCLAETRRRFRRPAELWPAGAEALWSGARRWDGLASKLGVRAQEARSKKLLETLTRVDALIAPSQFLADFYIEQGIDPNVIRVWRQGVELDQCRSGTASETLRVGYLGQMKRHKGVDLLLGGWSRLRGETPRTLTLYGSAAGEPEYERWLQGKVNDLEGVEWPGEFHGGEVWDVLANLDVLVVPSRWVENSPNAILEAQAVGVPVIGSDLGGVAELIEHNVNGLLFKVDDANALAEQLQRLLDEPDLLPKLRRSPIPFLSVDHEIDQIEGLYGEIRVAPHTDCT